LTTGRETWQLIASILPTLHFGDWRPADGFPFMCVIKLLGDQQAMPTQDRVGCEQSSDFFEQLATQHFATDRQPAPLIVVEQNSLLAKLLFEDLIFNSQVVDHVLLLAIDPAGKKNEHQMPRLENECHQRAILGEESLRLSTP
jgi:hypothetical protein